jgi:hypothetical protein
VAFDTNGCAWFSDVISVNAVSGQTNDLSVVLKKGSVVHGRLDAIVPRPVVNLGRGPSRRDFRTLLTTTGRTGSDCSR